MKYYVLFVWSDIEPELYGPYRNTDDRDEVAKKLNKEFGDHSGYFSIQSESEITVDSYSGAFMEN